jgi:hypothetical protein
MKAIPQDHPATDPFHIDLTTTRRWRSPQTWSANTPKRQPPAPRHKHRRAL